MLGQAQYRNELHAKAAKPTLRPPLDEENPVLGRLFMQEAATSGCNDFQPARHANRTLHSTVLHNVVVTQHA